MPFHRAVQRGVRASLATVTLVGLPGGVAQAQPDSAVDMTPDRARYVISKDVGDERWAITFNLDDRTVTGNVFKTDGGPPSFVWCEITNEIPSANPAQTEYTLDCFGSDGCSAAPCAPGRWTKIASDVSLNGAFLLPDGTASTLRGNVAPILDQNCATTSACHDGNDAAGGVNLRPNRIYRKMVLTEAAQVGDPDVFYVEPFDPDASYLIQKLAGEGVGAPMPLNSGPLRVDDVDAIRTWILEGAADN